MISYRPIMQRTKNIHKLDNLVVSMFLSYKQNIILNIYNNSSYKSVTFLLAKNNYRNKLFYINKKIKNNFIKLTLYYH